MRVKKIFVFLFCKSYSLFVVSNGFRQLSCKVIKLCNFLVINESAISWRNIWRRSCAMWLCCDRVYFILKKWILLRVPTRL